jgi:DNA-binding NarL/FixJ family response regulator
MSNETKIPVLIAHGNPLVAAGLEAAFGAREDFQLVTRRAPDDLFGAAARLGSVGVAVTDFEAGVLLLGVGGGEGCRVLMVTGSDSEMSIRKALKLGTRGYLPLWSPVDVVVRAVHSIHQGSMAIDPVAMTKIAASLASPALTLREMEVLRLMVNGLPNKSIANTLSRSVDTVKAHVRAILIKLGTATRTEAVEVARRRGLVPDDEVTMLRERRAARFDRDVGAWV